MKRSFLSKKNKLLLLIDLHFINKEDSGEIIYTCHVWLFLNQVIGDLCKRQFQSIIQTLLTGTLPESNGSKHIFKGSDSGLAMTQGIVYTRSSICHISSFNNICIWSEWMANGLYYVFSAQTEFSFINKCKGARLLIPFSYGFLKFSWQKTDESETHFCGTAKKGPV